MDPSRDRELIDLAHPETAGQGRLAHLLASAPAGVLIVDAQGSIVFANGTASAMFGYEPGELTGVAMEALVPEDARGVHQDDVAAFFRNPKVRSLGKGFDLRARRKDGTEFPAEIGLGFHRGVSDTLVIAIVSDISERVTATEAAIDRERQALEQLKLVDDLKTTFLHAVSHDLRTPLSAILGLSATLEREDMDFPADLQRDLAGRITRNARRLQATLEDLLDLDRLDRGIIEPRRSPVDAGALIRAFLRDVDVGDRQLHIRAEPVLIAIDKAKVERIVDNLVANASKHTPKGTDIWVRVQPIDDGVEVVVEDSGTGVPEADRQAIFEPFGRSFGEESPTPGMGIGLSLVKRFAEMHGGRAWVEDRPGGGASFHVVLMGTEGATHFG